MMHYIYAVKLFLQYNFLKRLKTAFILTFAPTSPGSPYKVQSIKTTLVKNFLTLHSDYCRSR